MKNVAIILSDSQKQVLAGEDGAYGKEWARKFKGNKDDLPTL